MYFTHQCSPREEEMTGKFRTSTFQKFAALCVKLQCLYSQAVLESEKNGMPLYPVCIYVHIFYM